MSIDLNFRPTSYADFDDPVSLALNGIKGQMRREMVRDMLTAERTRQWRSSRSVRHTCGAAGRFVGYRNSVVEYWARCPRCLSDGSVIDGTFRGSA